MSRDAGSVRRLAHPARPGTVPEAGKPSVGAGRAGLALTALSIAATIVTGLAGPSAMEPALPGRPGQPPWDLGLQLPPAAAIGLAAAALAAGTAGLGLCLHALRRGWTVSPRAVLAAGLTAAAAITLAPPFGSSDQLSYAAYGRMVVTGHDPYLTTPAMLARLGDPVARAVQDWRGSPSVYGGLATGGQALASWIGGGSARLTVFVLSLLGLAAFAGTGLLLHLLTRGSRPRQARAGLLWTLNPLLLQVLVAGAHVDSQAIAFAVAAIAVFALGMPNEKVRARSIRRLGLAAAAGALAGLACAVKLSFVLVAAGLLVAALLAWWPRPTSAGRPGRWRPLAPAVGGVMAGFMVTAAAALLPWGPQSAGPALRAGSYVSIGSPWRAVRSGLRLLVGEGHADSLVRAGAIVLAAALLALFARPLRRLAGAVTDAPAAVDPAGRGPAAAAPIPRDPAAAHPAVWGPVGRYPAVGNPAGVASVAAAQLTVLAGASCFVLGFAWLVAWPYVLPWYDGLGWALLALLPWTSVPWAALDWLVLARTAALAFGYLPARGITLPSGLGWLRSVVRTGVTPAALLAAAVTLVLLLWPYRPRWRPRAARRAGPDAGSTMGSRLAR
jgi:alpha-1,6-mannosyltransferase